MCSLEEIQSAWQKTDTPIILRQFIGDSQIGWKVAWSDRMVMRSACVFHSTSVHCVASEHVE